MSGLFKGPCTEGEVIWPFAEAVTKEGAQKSYDEAVKQYSRMRDLRNDILVNQYLSQDEKSELDASIERLVFNLMALERALENVKAIKYWSIKYRTELKTFNETRSTFTKKVEQISQDIHTRSSQRRGGDSKENAMDQPHLEVTSAGLLRCSNPSGDSDTLRDILDTLEEEAASSIRFFMEARNSNRQLTDSPQDKTFDKDAPKTTGFVVSSIGARRPKAEILGTPFQDQDPFRTWPILN
ncbi:hypothetical protein OPQ81_002186 [Rhizoctonia solani]|nr:hypothetical protein OPQ81_002186 [Rhizoctonia solani]